MYRHGVFAQAYMCTLPVTRARAWVRARTHTHACARAHACVCAHTRTDAQPRAPRISAVEGVTKSSQLHHIYLLACPLTHSYNMSVCVYRHVYLQGSAPRSTHMSTYSSACMPKHISRHTQAHTPTHTCLRTCLRTCLHTFSAGYLHHIHQPCSRHIAKPVATDCEVSQT